MQQSRSNAAYTPLPIRENELPVDSKSLGSIGKTRIFLWLSLLVNAILTYICFFAGSTLPEGICRSAYAGLLNDVSTTFTWSTDYSDPNNLDRVDELWKGDFEGALNYGMVAIKPSEAEQLSLPPSEVPWAWESSRGTYVLEGHHSLHCLRLVYLAVSNYRAGVEQHTSHQHVVHCLDNLRQSVMCHADDTPLFLTRNGSHSGENQARQCRSFSKLNQWSAQRDACYKFIEPPGPDMAEIERYKYCKQEGNTMDKVREFFGFGADWQPFPYQVQQEYLTEQALAQKLEGMSAETRERLGLK